MVLFIESKPQDIVETEMQSLSLNSCYLPTGFTLTVRSKIEQSKHKQKYQDLAIRYFCFLFSGFSLPVSSALKAAHFSRSFSVFKIEKEQIRKKS